MICIMDCPALSFLIVHTRSGAIGLVADVYMLKRVLPQLEQENLFQCVASHLFECVCRTVSQMEENLL